jgi:hypothetical protein
VRKSKRPGRLRHAEQQLADARERLAIALDGTIARQEAAARVRLVLENILEGVPVLVAGVEKLDAGEAPAALYVALKGLIYDFRVALSERLAKKTAQEDRDGDADVQSGGGCGAAGEVEEAGGGAARAADRRANGGGHGDSGAT